MIATHNIKVNGVWVCAGEEYQPENAVTPVEKPEEKPVEEAPKAEPEKEAPKAKSTSTRRKKVSE